LRLGHRLPRDERISTHVALVARAFGANSIVYSGQHDSGLEDSVKRICEQWGGNVDGKQFAIAYEKNAIKLIKKRKTDGYTILHLTMYGLSLNDKEKNPLEKIKNHEIKNKKLLIVVGSEQVPGEVYKLADYNISVTNQPHSEVAALAIVLDRLQQGRELDENWNDFQGKIKIEPKENGKKIIENKKDETNKK
ncbi:tRNA (cytidine(56)-2'-O)-methyltransferase, partial [Candidatus Micrarchaeota archaeon]|nr:tRNA (cytidine(56)-2'-O)-methyltransferase [Candidatus Micrarchaeota archaeon]